MSLNLIKKNSSSPFHLQRSMVDQGGEGGAYEQGGFNPNIVYNNDAANAAIESFGKTIGAALASRTKEDRYESDVKTKTRLDKKEARLSDKNSKLTGMADVSKRVRIKERLERVDKKQAKVEGRIADYNKSQNPLAGSDIIKRLDAAASNKPVAETASSKPNDAVNNQATVASLFNPKNKQMTNYSDNANLKASKKETPASAAGNIAGPQEMPGPVFFDYKKAREEDLNNKLKFFGK
jgi:hypothetical protein